MRPRFLCPDGDLLIQVWLYIILTKMFNIYLCWSSSYANENRSAADPVPLTMITGTFILIRLVTCSISHGLPWINKLTSGILVHGTVCLSSGEFSSEIFSKISYYYVRTLLCQIAKASLILLFKNWMHSFEVSLGYESVDRSTFSMKRRSALCWKCASINAFIP